ncbi:cytochrome c(L), periplasmic [Roseovarius atlanticus]|uniref:cytochrome c(L), periplasmic n=1 Tax=Roseovarius atlanticus TaxID=1641875 RepID=UPI001C94F992|nr:cytochrome c(L), periplasmic [Roseovarius atlanticus]MBY5989994.1 cytochrome c(L), periplasmic [Roseovarius atlanticus]MBY6126539.1 cytochrome c(L), periplasmic [Roseovarius atlanticus]MBY6151033.1 cytochrome c(L), periplasmic [Roseovarius atlanticus]
MTLHKRQIALAGLAISIATVAYAAPRFYNTVDGSPLDFDLAMEEGSDTEAVRTFMDTGVNIYNENPEYLDQGESIYSTACSGCHGHYAEGKIGPGLNDDYWTYPRNEEDVGLFSTLYGGASGQMGPMWGALTLDEMLLAMAWVRHLYTGDPETATWLTEEQREEFTPFDPDARKSGG